MLKTIIILLVSVGGFSLWGEETNKTRFASMADCKMAVRSGEFVNYIPSFLDRHREPMSGEGVRPLEERACVEMDIVGGRGFVPQPAGEKFIFFGANPVARYDCGNRIHSIEYVPVPASAPPPSPAPAPLPVPEPEVNLPPAEQSAELDELPPPPDWPEPQKFQATLVWDNGRPLWTKLPVVHCLYTYTAGIKDWSKWGAAEKLGFCPAEAALAWWLWPVSGPAAMGRKIVPPVGVISPP